MQFTQVKDQDTGIDVDHNVPPTETDQYSTAGPLFFEINRTNIAENIGPPGPLFSRIGFPVTGLSYPPNSVPAAQWRS